LKVLITGGAGFIGSHLSDRLLARGDEVLVIDNYATGRRDNLTRHPRLAVVEGSIADPDLFDRNTAAFRPEVIVHAAASYRDPDDWQEDARTNALGSAIVARAAKRNEVRRLIYFQTSLCYGLHPLEQPITLAHPIVPAPNSYAISKTAGEQYVALSGVDWQSFRLANAYGPRNISGPLPTFFQRLTGGKPCFVADTRRDFIYVQDLIDVVEKAVDGVGASGAYHISTGSDHSIKELFDATLAALAMELDEPVEVRERGPDDAFTILIDPSKTIADFQWRPATPLAEGVRAAIDYYRKFGISQTFTHLRMKDESKPE
jgi:UDP-glucose 4-epimerase